MRDEIIKKDIVNEIHDSKKIIDDLTKQIQKTINSIYASLTNEEIDEYKVNLKYFEAWRKSGWVFYEYLPFSILYEIDQDNKKTDNDIIIFNRYYKDISFENIIERCAFNQILNKEVLDEMLFCFMHEKYISCTCLLFICIENLLYNIDTHQNNKTTGKKKINTLLTNSEICSQLYQKHILEVLRMFYENSRNLEKINHVINRNRLFHGQLNEGEVTYKECIRLLVALDATSSFFMKINNKNHKQLIQNKKELE